MSHLIRFYRVRHFNFPHKASITAKPYPARPEHCITFCVRGSVMLINPANQETVETHGIYLSGQYTQRINKLCLDNELLMILVVFLPGAIQQLTGMPANRLQDTGVNLGDIFYRETRQLEEQLANTEGYGAMLRLIDNYFLRAFGSTNQLDVRPVHQLFRHMMHAIDILQVERLARQACLSIRQLERYFLYYCGTSPSKMMQILRFDRAYRMRLLHPEYPWLRIAMHCGFHDYQHLAKAFKEFAIASPNQLFKEEDRAPEKILGLSSPAIG